MAFYVRVLMALVGSHARYCGKMYIRHLFPYGGLVCSERKHRRVKSKRVKARVGAMGIWEGKSALPSLACVAGVQRGGRGEVECERKARRAPNDRASRSHSTTPLPPLCTPATQAMPSQNPSFFPRSPGARRTAPPTEGLE